MRHFDADGHGRARKGRPGAALTLALLMAACTGDAARGPQATSTLPPASGTAVRGLANTPPQMILRTTPAADTATNPPAISGPPPLTVRFNVCRSEDQDQGDSLNWQFNFGDSGRPAFNSDGTFNPDFDHFCRVEHVYGEGTFLATVSVTDKHLEDQGHEVAALARTTQQVRIVAASRPAPSAPTRPCPNGGDCLVFVTSTTYQSNFGGAGAANALCQARAQAAGRPGTYKAWISDASSSPASRFTRSTGRYVRVDGVKVADNWADLADGSLAAPISVTESGDASLSAFAWTGTNTDGTPAPETCMNWTSIDPSDNGRAGNSFVVDALWSDAGASSCDGSIQFRLYCFQQD